MVSVSSQLFESYIHYSQVLGIVRWGW